MWSVLLVAVLLLSGTGCGSIRRFHRTGDASEDHMKISVPTAANIVLRSTVLATVKAPITSSKVGMRTCADRVYTFLNGGMLASALDLRGDGENPPQPGSEAFEALLDQRGLPARSSGTVKFLVNGSSFFPEFHRAIDGAKKQVDVQFYIFDNDPVAVEVAEKLKRKSGEAPVRVLYDPIGSRVASEVDPPKASEPRFESLRALMADMKRDSNVQLRATSNPYFVSDHTKLLVVDDRTAYIGGMNIGAEYLHEWHDMMVQVEGPIVQPMSRLFEEHWRGEEWLPHLRFRGWFEKEEEEARPPAARPGGKHAPLRMLLTGSSPARRDVLKATLAAIRCARERVWIESPYFAMDEITAEVRRAMKRGVDVRVIIPGNVDAKFMNKVNAAELRDLLKTGVKVYEYPGMTHLKATVCDGWATFGSANYDTLSMRINRELNVATSDPATVQALIRKVFEPDFRVSAPLTVEKARARGGLLTEMLGDQM